jgi:DNA uptake protein ComE-like DNA-binding protein
MRLRHRNAEGLLDLNSATFVELRALTGIDDESAERILENRPYLTKLDLIGRRVIPDATYAAIKQFVTIVHQA